MAPPAAPRLSRPVLLGSLGLLGVAILAGLLVGPASLPVWGTLAELLDRLPFVSLDSGLDERQAAIVWELRFPRVILGVMVGAALSVSGAAYQGVFRNPLADPYLLGVAAGVLQWLASRSFRTLYDGAPRTARRAAA